jgi:hypothetical protein
MLNLSGPQIVFDTDKKFDGLGGGSHRAMQVYSLLQQACVIVSLVNTDYNPRFHKRRLIAGFLGRHRLSLPTKTTLNSYRHLGVAIQSYVQHLSEISQNSIFVTERTLGTGHVGVTIAKKMGFSTIAFPQNLEAFVPGQIDPIFTYRDQNAACKSELAFLASCDLVVCISREEQWLLNNFGIQAEFLPYFPLENRISELHELRNSRTATDIPRRFLVLGDASNPAVGGGMKKLLKILLPIATELGAKIDIAGHHTDKLSRDSYKDTFIFHGFASKPIFNKLIIESHAAILFQEQAGGALTRIIDFLVAGLPILCNPMAARTYYNTSGIYVFSNDTELEALMKSDFPMPALPEVPLNDYKRIIDTLRSFFKL